jgi:hypothetical protein
MQTALPEASAGAPHSATTRITRSGRRNQTGAFYGEDPCGRERRAAEVRRDGRRRRGGPGRDQLTAIEGVRALCPIRARR